MSRSGESLQHTATHCSTLQPTASYYSTLQHTVTHCTTLQHICNTLHHTTAHCNTLQHTAAHYNTLQHTTTHCNTLQHTTSYYSTLQLTVTLCSTLSGWVKNRSCHIYTIHVTFGIQISHVIYSIQLMYITCVNEWMSGVRLNVGTCEWVKTGHVTYDRVMLHKNKSCHISHTIDVYHVCD